MKQYWLFIVTVLIFSVTVLADMGPKPTAEFLVTLEGKLLQETAGFSGVMLQCVDPSVLENNDYLLRCKEGDPSCTHLSNFSVPDANKNCIWIRAELAWGSCAKSNCEFHYFLPDPFRLAVYLPSTDMVYLSPSMERNNFNSEFSADLHADGTITLKETTSLTEKSRKLLPFFVALMITLFFELWTYFIYTLIKKAKGVHLSTTKLLITVLIMNIITLPLLWFWVTGLMTQIGWMLLIAEIGITIVEAAVIFFVMKKEISLRTTILLCVIANATSFILGGIIFFFLALFFQLRLN